MKFDFRHEWSRWCAPKLGFSVNDPMFDDDTCWVVRVDLLYLSLFFYIFPDPEKATY